MIAKRLYLLLIFAGCAQLHGMEQREKEPTAQETEQEKAEIQKLLKTWEKPGINALKLYAALPCLRRYSKEKIETLNIPQEVKEYLEEIKQELTLRLGLSWYLTDIDALKILLKYGADPNKLSPGPWRYLFNVMMENDEQQAAEIIQLLSNYGIDINAKEPKYGESALLFATVRGWPHLVKTLLDLGADTSITNREGKTALAIAQRWHPEIAKLIKEHSAAKK